MKHSLLAAAAFGLSFAVAPFASVNAAELKVLAGGGMTNELKELGPMFERATGHKVTFVFAATPDLIKLATSQPFDAAVVPMEVFQNAEARSKLVAAPTVDIARVGFGVAIKSGAPKPDIGTPDAFKKTMLDARSVTFLPASAAGAAIVKVFDRLGIAEAMKAKTKPQTSTAAIAPAVAGGDVELGVFLLNVLVAPGIDIVGPFPGELQSELVYTSGIAADSTQAPAAEAFVNFLRTPEAAATIRAKGMKAS